MAQWLNGSMAQWLKLCLLALLGAVATEAYSFDTFSGLTYAQDENIPPVIPDLLPEEIPLPPRSDSTLKPPIHIYKTNDGRQYSIQMDYGKDKQYQIYKYFLTEKDKDYLDRLDVPIKYLKDFGSLSSDETHGADKAGKKYKNTNEKTTQSLTTKAEQTCYQSNLPSETTIHYDPSVWNWKKNDYGIVHGNIGVCQTGVGHYRQTISYLVKTHDYYGKAAHTATIGWFKAQHHGIGMYFGDTSDLACQAGAPGYGDNGKHNTRIEAWSIWYDNPSNLPEKKSSTAFNYNGTCGAPWQDDEFYYVFLYSSSYGGNQQWSQYRIYHYDYNVYNWILHTPLVTQHVGFSSWVSQGVSNNGANGVLDSTAKGTWIGSTGPLVPSPIPSQYQVPWEIKVYNIASSWN